jgi:hypothetical protein
VLNKDWSGDKMSLFRILGSSAHSVEERESNDFYATDPKAGYDLCNKLEKLDNVIIDNSVGEGHLLKEFVNNGFKLIGYDIVDRNKIIELDKFVLKDFLELETIEEKDFSIVMNPPYSKALEFVQKSLDLQREGGKVCAFLKIQFLEGKKRRLFFKDNPPVRVWVSSSRIQCVKNGNFDKIKEEKQSSAVCYAWFIWEKGYKGETTLKWFN